MASRPLRAGARLRAERRPEDREQELYATALRLFRQKGYHGTSMQDIADELGLYKGSLYHYIGSKEDLLRRVFEQAMGSLLEQIEAIVADRSTPPSEQLRQEIHALVQAVAHNLEALSVYFQEWRSLAGESLARVRAQQERYHRCLGLILERGVAAGELRVADLPLASLGIEGMCNWLCQWYRPDGRLSADDIAERFADLVLSGLAIGAQPKIMSPTVSPSDRITLDE